MVVTKVSSCWISAFVAMFLVVMFAPAVNGSITNLTTSWWRRGFVASFVTVNTSIYLVVLLEWAALEWL